ncbi:hypothetical protein GCM10007063_24860 [Lentibacillus kapialis]|uniref:ABC transporter domain-containing protein n=1 Tax=Lentibacillus kapialis TaxID=340214 RepID=A0A917PZX4_9BACI|nr:teichoic acids export ABC transporter ATP-binding subunit TagH [Lentibacillus kapialis]GGK01594.1 hypothetical protein GCM10007063_24860 [Lentibacillus kapialis]
MDKAITVKNISKKYKLYNNGKERLGDLLTPKSYGKDFYALTDVSFEAEKGDVVGFIGINGSGKSTLSNIIAGIIPETSGTVKVNGYTSLIAVSSGLKGELSGRDNIELKLLMLGFNKSEIKDLEPGIIEFSELGTFIDQPVKSYSSGMKSRLGFAISVNVDPDVLIIDEALSVGDKAFAEKSYQKMVEFKKMDKTMIFVSHSLGQMRKFCEKILWLEYGRVRAFGTVDEVIPKYEAFLSFWKKLSHNDRERYKQSIMEGQIPDEWYNNGEDHEDSEEITEFIEEPTSRLGHVKGGVSHIYSSPAASKKETDGEPTDRYKNKVYYIKKQATYKDETFYLLSQEPSAMNGIVGWMKGSDMSSRQHIAIDTDEKTFHFIGTGQAFEHPWGGKKDKIIDDMEPYRDTEFKVNRTVKVGNDIWYRGTLNERHIWLPQNHLKS